MANSRILKDPFPLDLLRENQTKTLKTHTKQLLLRPTLNIEVKGSSPFELSSTIVTVILIYQLTNHSVYLESQITMTKFQCKKMKGLSKWSALIVILSFPPVVTEIWRSTWLYPIVISWLRNLPHYRCPSTELLWQVPHSGVLRERFRLL